MQDWRSALSDVAGAQWLLIGVGLVTAPVETMQIAGLDVRSTAAQTVSRVLGLRDLALGSALLSSEDAATRRVMLRAVAAMAAGELGLMLWLGRERSGGAAVRLSAASAVTVATAIIASTSQDKTSSRGVPLLLAGYLLSVAPGLRWLAVLRRRERRSFAAFEAGCVLLSLGWRQRGRAVGAVCTGLAAAGVALVWSLAGRRSCLIWPDRRRRRRGLSSARQQSA